VSTAEEQSDLDVRWSLRSMWLLGELRRRTMSAWLLVVSTVRWCPSPESVACRCHCYPRLTQSSRVAVGRAV